MFSRAVVSTMENVFQNTTPTMEGVDIPIIKTGSLLPIMTTGPPPHWTSFKAEKLDMFLATLGFTAVLLVVAILARELKRMMTQSYRASMERSRVDEYLVHTKRGRALNRKRLKKMKKKKRKKTKNKNRFLGHNAHNPPENGSVPRPKFSQDLFGCNNEDHYYEIAKRSTVDSATKILFGDTWSSPVLMGVVNYLLFGNPEDYPALYPATFPPPDDWMSLVCRVYRIKQVGQFLFDLVYCSVWIPLYAIAMVAVVVGEIVRRNHRAIIKVALMIAVQCAVLVMCIEGVEYLKIRVIEWWSSVVFPDITHPAEWMPTLLPTMPTVTMPKMPVLPLPSLSAMTCLAKDVALQILLALNDAAKVFAWGVVIAAHCYWLFHAMVAAIKGTTIMSELESHWRETMIWNAHYNPNEASSTPTRPPSDTRSESAIWNPYYDPNEASSTLTRPPADTRFHSQAQSYSSSMTSDPYAPMPASPPPSDPPVMTDTEEESMEGRTNGPNPSRGSSPNLSFNFFWDPECPAPPPPIPYGRRVQFQQDEEIVSDDPLLSLETAMEPPVLVASTPTTPDVPEPIHTPRPVFRESNNPLLGVTAPKPDEDEILISTPARVATAPEQPKTEEQQVVQPAPVVVETFPEPRTQKTQVVLPAPALVETPADSNREEQQARSSTRTLKEEEELLSRFGLESKQQAINDTFIALQAANRIQGEEMPVTQGGLTANGCTVISFFTSLVHMLGYNGRGPRVTNTDIETIIKTLAVPILRQIRGQQSCFCDWFEVTGAFSEPNIGPSLYDKEDNGDKTADGEFIFGNLFIESHFEGLIDKVADPDNDKTATALLFQNHAIAVLKLGDSTGFEVVDSLTKRWWCRDAEALRACLNWYAYKNVNYRQIARPSTGADAGDPRQFQAIAMKPRTVAQQMDWVNNAMSFATTAFGNVAEIWKAQGEEALFNYCTSEPQFPEDKLGELFPEYVACLHEQEACVKENEESQNQIKTDEEFARQQQLDAEREQFIRELPVLEQLLAEPFE